MSYRLWRNLHDLLDKFINPTIGIDTELELKAFIRNNIYDLSEDGILVWIKEYMILYEKHRKQINKPCFSSEDLFSNIRLYYDIYVAGNNSFDVNYK